ncbi:MAG: type 1 glutamine amidotransferase domain-containing protein [Frankia sp.]
MAVVVVPVPAHDSDPTEVAVSWRVLVDRGHRVMFSTPSGRPAECDDVMVTGRGLDLWSRFAPLERGVLVGRVLRADAAGRAAHAALQRDAAWLAPTRWDGIDLDQADGLLLPGGHRARGMRPYLESPVLRRLVVDAFRRDLPVGAICHGVLLVARSVDPATGRSVLFGRRTTALTWRLERTADRIARVTRRGDPGYYRTYDERPGEPVGYRSVQREVTRALRSPADFLDVPRGTPDARRKAAGVVRDRPGDPRASFVVRDGGYVTARWPGDAHTFAETFADVLAGRADTRRDGGAGARPDVRTPDVRTPDVRTPDVRTPDVRTPDVPKNLEADGGSRWSGAPDVDV